MAGSPGLKHEGRPLSLRSDQLMDPAASFPHFFNRLGRTIEVDFSKCHAIVKDTRGELRQCKKTQTPKGDDSLCSANHNKELGRVRESMIFEQELIDFFRSPQEVSPSYGPRRSAIPGTKRIW